MTKDFRLKHQCPHTVRREWRALENGQILRTDRNPSSSKAISIHVNGSEIPSEGRSSDITISGQKKGPFDIDQSNDRLEFSVNETSESLTLPHGTNLRAEQIAEPLDDQSKETTISTSNGRMTISVDKDKRRRGQIVNLFLTGGSSHDTLGFPDRRFYSGRMIFPGWSVQKDPQSVTSDQKMIVFDEPLETNNHVVEVTYQTVRESCGRCQGLGIEHDIRFDRQGDADMIDGLGLLIQEAEKIVFTEKGSSVFFPWYGTEIVNEIGTKITESNDLLEARIRNSVTQALKKYKNIKQQQSDVQAVSNQEFPLKVKSVIVEQSPSDPSVFDIRIHIMNRARELEEVSQRFVMQEGIPEGIDRVE